MSREKDWGEAELESPETNYEPLAVFMARLKQRVEEMNELIEDKSYGLVF